MKRRNPRFDCRKIAEHISRTFKIAINKDVIRPCSSSTTDLDPAETGLHDSRSSAMRRTVCGASTSFVANRFCSKTIGS
jgi:hypothetical protein